MNARVVRDAMWQVASACARPVLGGLGCILALHRVVPEGARSLLPSNRALEITPEDLRAMLGWLKKRAIEVVSLDEMLERLKTPRAGRFISFTFDDGYRDNLTHALPVFREFGAPLAVNITNGFVGRTASVWWYFLEEALNSDRPLSFRWEDRDYRYAAKSTSERNQALEEISRLIRSLGIPRDALLKVIGEAAGLDPLAGAAQLCLTWNELQDLTSDPLVTIGAHTASHHSLNRLSEAEIFTEVETAREELARSIGREVRHFVYPFGGPNAVAEREFGLVARTGFATMLTTRPGNLNSAHVQHLDHLPRLTISGNHPVLKALRLAESGLTAWRERRE